MHLGAVDDEIARRGSDGSIDLARQFEETVLHHRDKITHPDLEKAVDVAFRMTYCTFARQVMYGPTFESDREISWDDLVEEVGTACGVPPRGTLRAAKRRASAERRSPDWLRRAVLDGQAVAVYKHRIEL